MTQVCPRRYFMYYPQLNVNFWGDVLFKSSIYFQFVVTERCKKQYHVWNISPDFYKPAVCDCQMSVRSFLTYNQSLTDLLSGCPVGARLRCPEPTETTKKSDACVQYARWRSSFLTVDRQRDQVQSQDARQQR